MGDPIVEQVTILQQFSTVDELLAAFGADDELGDFYILVFCYFIQFVYCFLLCTVKAALTHCHK